jgi:superfamily II DNA/RNA helicase
MSFDSLNLHTALLKAVSASGYSAPTAIQQAAIPEVLAGHDLMASAQTGTGKTAAFMLPALHRLAAPSTGRGRGPRVLVLTPTRELAQQVNDATQRYGRFLRVQSLNVLGGMPYGPQIKGLGQALDILVATPGRLMDHMNAGRVDFSRLEMLILDEADRMLDMGFIDDVQQIAAATPRARQTLLFSATLEGRIALLARDLLRDPRLVQIGHVGTKHENIEQRLHYVDDLGHKSRLLEHLLGESGVDKTIVFTATKRDADALAEALHAKGHAAAALHGDMNQRARSRTLQRLHRGAVRVLVATDVAARGIDVNGISHVINFDLPKQAEDYVHRIGRTGRAGANGIAISFASYRDRMQVQRIERYTGQSLAAHVVPGLEPQQRPRRSAEAGDRGRRPTSGAPRRGAPNRPRTRSGEQRTTPRRGW